MTSWYRIPMRGGLILVFVLVAAEQPRAETLPIRTYTMEDGLPSDDVRGIARDSRGYLWFLTGGGLSRFDGMTFTVFGPSYGLPNDRINDWLETRDGTVLVATRGGVYWHDHFDPGSRQGFRRALPVESGQGNHIHSLVEDPTGQVFCATHAGVYRMDRVEEGWRFHPVDIRQPAEDIERNNTLDMVVDETGAFWITTPAGLIWIAADGATEFLTHRDGLPHRDCSQVTRDSNARTWVATREGVAVFETDPVTGRPGFVRAYGAREGLVGPTGVAPKVWEILNAADGTHWAATASGLIQFFPDASADEPSMRGLFRSNGLSSADVLALHDDLEGNLWLGTSDAGAMRISRGGFVTYGPDDGLHAVPNRQIFSGPTGELLVVGGARYVVHRFDGRAFDRITPQLPSSIEDLGWGYRQISFQDSRGEWWFGTFGGLVRFPPVSAVEDLASSQPKAHYTRRDGLLSNGVFRVYEDSRGDLWLGVMHYTVPERNGLQRWDRETETFRTYREADGAPQDAATAIREDHAGNVWVGFYQHGLGRVRRGTYEHFEPEHGVPAGQVTSMHLDRRLRLWIGTSDGVFRVDDPDADEPTFRRYDTAEGPGGGTVTCITEDDWGRIYLGTHSGVDRLDPDSGDVRHYSSAHGLGSNRILNAHRDAEGSLWFGTTQGISKLVPGEEPPNEAPPVRILGLRIAGEPRPVSPFGENDINGIRLTPTERQLEIDYSGLSFVTGEELRFQFVLRPADPEWSEPSGNRRVQFASLSPGRYRFAVRAVDSGGLVSPEPATVSFRVLPPFWRTWWFASLVGAMIAGVAFAVHRARVRRMVELERVRTRIATDLHDDIGASLSQVSILSEVVRQQVQGDDPRSAEPLLDQIANSARDLVDSMSDIVWAVNPRRDRAGDLVQRMRRFASDTLAGKGIEFEFTSSTGDLERRLDIDLRRQVYLVFKEAVNNLLRHSGCARARIDFAIEGKLLSLSVADDGRGFETSGGGDGHGLASMRQRAQDLGGTLEIESTELEGTSVTLLVPLGQNRI